MTDRLKKLDVDPRSFDCRDERPLIEWLDEGWQVIWCREYTNGYPYSREVLLYRPPVVKEKAPAAGYGSGRW